MDRLTPETQAEWRKEHEARVAYHHAGSIMTLHDRRILTLLDALAAAESRDALGEQANDANLGYIRALEAVLASEKAAREESEGELARLRPLHARLTERWQQAEAIAVAEHERAEQAEAEVIEARARNADLSDAEGRMRAERDKAQAERDDLLAAEWGRGYSAGLDYMSTHGDEARAELSRRTDRVNELSRTAANMEDPAIRAESDLESLRAEHERDTRNLTRWAMTRERERDALRAAVAALADEYEAMHPELDALMDDLIAKEDRIESRLRALLGDPDAAVQHQCADELHALLDDPGEDQ